VAQVAGCTQINTKHTSTVWAERTVVECWTCWYLTQPGGFKRLNCCAAIQQETTGEVKTKRKNKTRIAVRKGNGEVTTQCNKPLTSVFYNFHADGENKTSL
jgi:hypothetical protein